MRVLLTTLVLLLGGLSGCSSGSDATDGPASTQGADGEVPAADHPSGLPPVEVRVWPVPETELDYLFRIAIPGPTVDLEWSLDADGDGSADAGGATLPAEVVHAYEAEGTNDAVVTLVGNGTTRDLAVPVDVVRSVVLQGTTTVVSGPHKRDTGHTDCVGFQAGQDGMDCLWFPLDGMDGWRFVATSREPPAPVTDLEFLTTCDATSTASLGMHTGDARGHVPEGAGCVLLWGWGANVGTLTVTLTPQHDS